MKFRVATKILLVFCVAPVLCGCDKRSSSGENQAVEARHSDQLALRSTGSFSKAISSNPTPQNINTQLFTRMAGRPSRALLDAVRPADKAELTAYYVSHLDPLDRHAATWALGLVGDEQTVDLFARALTNDFNGRKLAGRRSNASEMEEHALESTIYALGFLGAKYDSAFQFLVGATEASFWAENKKWQSDTGADEIGILTTISISALGMTGREEVPRLLESMKDKPLKNHFDPSPRPRTFEDGVVDAAFHYSVFRERGSDGFKAWYLGHTSDPFDGDGSFRKWKMSEEGKAWFEWYQGR